MKVARILHVLTVVMAIVLLAMPVMVLAGNDPTLQEKPLPDVELQSFNGMGSFTLYQQNYPSGTNNNQSSFVSGFSATNQPFTTPNATQTQTINVTTVSPTAHIWVFQHHP